MAYAERAPNGAEVGLRVTVRHDGTVAVDLTYQNRGGVKRVQPLTSTTWSTPSLSVDQVESVLTSLTRAARGILVERIR